MVPDADLLKGSFQAFPRRRRIHELEREILDNPSAGNYEELGLLYLDDGDFARARACYDKAISSRADSVDPFYRRGVAEIELEDSQRPCQTWSARSIPIRSTISIAPGTAGLGIRADGTAGKANAMFRRQRGSRPFLKRTITTRCFCSRKDASLEAREWARKILRRSRRCRRFAAAGASVVSESERASGSPAG